MYDLEALRYLNEQAHIRAVALANERASPVPETAPERVVINPPPVFPLSILARKLLGGPPSLRYFIELVELSSTFQDFLNLVREFLPEHEADIMAQDLPLRAGRFCQYFSKTYFPLCDDAVDGEYSVRDLMDRIPTQPLGFSYESYHAFTDFRQGYILLLSLVAHPWEDDDDDDESGTGARVPILEYVREVVGDGLAGLIPTEGWSIDFLHEKTDDTEFKGCGDFAEWVMSETGTYHLDARGEDTETGQSIDWEPVEVEGLVDDWQRAKEILDKIHSVALLLEEDTESNFRKLLSILLDNKALIIPKEQMPLPL